MIFFRNLLLCTSVTCIFCFNACKKDEDSLTLAKELELYVEVDSSTNQFILTWPLISAQNFEYYRIFVERESDGNIEILTEINDYYQQEFIVDNLFFEKITFYIELVNGSSPSKYANVKITPPNVQTVFTGFPQHVMLDSVNNNVILCLYNDTTVVYDYNKDKIISKRRIYDIDAATLNYTANNPELLICDYDIGRYSPLTLNRTDLFASSYYNTYDITTTNRFVFFFFFGYIYVYGKNGDRLDNRYVYAEGKMSTLNDSTILLLDDINYYNKELMLYQFSDNELTQTKYNGYYENRNWSGKSKVDYKNQQICMLPYGEVFGFDLSYKGQISSELLQDVYINNNGYVYVAPVNKKEIVVYDKLLGTNSVKTIKTPGYITHILKYKEQLICVLTNRALNMDTYDNSYNEYSRNTPFVIHVVDLNK